MRNKYIPKNFVIHQINEVFEDCFILKCTFEIFQIDKYESIEQDVCFNLSHLNSLLKLEKGIDWEYLEHSLAIHYQITPFDFFEYYSNNRSEKLVLKYSEVVVDVCKNDNNEELHLVFDVFPIFIPDNSKYNVCFWEFEQFNPLFENIITSVKKVAFLKQRGYCHVEAMMITNLNHPLAQIFVKCFFNYYDTTKTMFDNMEEDYEDYHYWAKYGVFKEDDEDPFESDDETELDDDLPF